MPKGKAGEVHVRTTKGRLQLTWTYKGVRQYLTVGLSDTPEHRQVAKLQASVIEADILYDRYDETLEKYKSRNKLSLDNPDKRKSLRQIWGKYLEYKRPQCSPSTMANQYRAYSSYLDKTPTDDPSKSLEIRDYALRTIPVNSAKRFMVALNACCEWAVKAGLLDKNSFKGMAGEINVPKASTEDEDIDPFSIEERDRIIEGFKQSRYYKHYAPLVEFLFSTGCRPSEALGLQWKHISKDCSQIKFEQALIRSENGLIVNGRLKTQEKRTFPCNKKLQSFLKSLERGKPTDYVFPSPTGKHIDFHNFTNRAWKSVLEEVGVHYRKAYNARHSWITYAIRNGLDAKDVAKLAGNSAEIIYRNYVGVTRDLKVPEF